jgi:long-chain acyl-CoA synthetase
MKLRLSTIQEWSWFWNEARKRTSSHLELYAKDIWITSPAGTPPVRLHLFELGPECAAQTLVLLHGFSGSSATFQPLLLPLAQRHRVLAFDLRGHGGSSRPPNGYTVSQMVDDVAAALDALPSAGPVIAVGDSAGGFVATEFALRYPERVSKVVLIVTPVAVREELLPWIWSGSMHLPDSVFRLIETFPGLVPYGSSYHLGIKQFYQDMLRWDGTQKFPQLTQPTLVITGSHDDLLGCSDFTAVAGLIPQSEHVNVGVADHMLPFERSQAVLRAMEHFIAPDPATRFAPRWRSENDDVNSPQLLAEHPWVARYDQGVPATLGIPPVPLTRLLDVAAQRFGQRPALRYLGQTITYRELLDEVNRFAQALQRLGISVGDRVLLALPERPHWVVAFFGTLRVGAIAVLAPRHGSVAALSEEARQTGARVLVTMEAGADVARQVMAMSQVQYLVCGAETNYERRTRARRTNVISKVMLGQTEFAWPELLAASTPTAVTDAATATDTAAILFTAGRGGVPRAIHLTHRSLVANALQIGAWLPDVQTGHDSIVSAVPFSHAYGLAMGLNAATHLAATLVLLPHFGVEPVLQELRREQPRILVAAPQLYIALADIPDIRRYFSDTPHLCLSGAAPLAVETKEAFERLTHTRVIEGYARSAVGQLMLNPLQASRTGSVGLPLPGIDAQILDLDSGAPLPAGQIGELVVRGPQVMAGYWSGEASRGLDTEGWLPTGDLACIDDDGYFHLLGRREDVWHTSTGEVVYPRDVEETINELPEVNEVAVIAVENQPMAFIRLDQPAEQCEQLTPQTVLDFCRRRLPPSHQPQAVIFVDEFPRNEVGRIVRDAVLREHAAEVEARLAKQGLGALTGNLCT